MVQDFLQAFHFVLERVEGLLSRGHRQLKVPTIPSWASLLTRAWGLEFWVFGSAMESQTAYWKEREMKSGSQ